MLASTNSFTVRKNDRRKREEDATSQPLYIASPLILPDISSVPVSVWPEVSFIEDTSCLEAWGEFIIEMIPDCDASWRKGTAKGKIFGDIFSLLEKAVVLCGADNGLFIGEASVAVRFENNRLTLSVSPFEEIYPLLCGEALERVQKSHPSFYPLVKKAFTILFNTMYAWDNLWEEAFDYHRDSARDNSASVKDEGATAEYVEANREELKYHRGAMRDLKKFDTSKKGGIRKKKITDRFVKIFTEEIALYRAASNTELEKNILRWCRNVVSLWKIDPFQVLSADDNDMTLGMGEIFPLLWSRGDDVTEWYDSKMDDYSNSGYSLEALLKIYLGKEKEHDRESFCLLKKDIYKMGLFRKVFSFW